MKFDSHSTQLHPRLHRLAAIIGFVALSSAASAHPGHSILEVGAAHVFSSPYHVAVLAGGGLALLGSAWFIRQQTFQRIVQYAGAFALAAAVLLWGFRA